MAENQSVAIYEQQPISPEQVLEQVRMIQNLMKSAMTEGVHYGTVKGCGDKPTLLQPGAEKILFMFRMVADPEVEVIELPNPSVPGHREYRAKVRVYSKTGVFLGGGVGACSTMETKYRYRVGPMEDTGKPVPRDYWDIRKSDPDAAQEMIGGKGFGTHKNEEGAWTIVRRGERIEYPDPADYYNTCEKMAKKRALVDAVKMVTAASDIFTQDVEDMEEPPADISNLSAVRQKVIVPEASKKEGKLITPDQFEDMKFALTKKDLWGYFDGEKLKTLATKAFKAAMESINSFPGDIESLKNALESMRGDTEADPKNAEQLFDKLINGIRGFRYNQADYSAAKESLKSYIFEGGSDLFPEGAK